MEIRQVGETALLLECAEAAQVEAWRAELWRRREAGQLTAVDLVPGALTLLIDGVPDPVAAAQVIPDGRRLSARTPRRAPSYRSPPSMTGKTWRRLPPDGTSPSPRPSTGSATPSGG